VVAQSSLTAPLNAGYVVEYLSRLVMPLESVSQGSSVALTCVDLVGAGDRDRTGMASLEGWGHFTASSQVRGMITVLRKARVTSM
jgi:hypothetical protein